MLVHHLSFTGQHRAHTNTRTHVHARILHEFSIIQIGFPNWVRAGGSRRFSLSIGRGFPAKLFPRRPHFESYKFAIPSAPDS